MAHEENDLSGLDFAVDMMRNAPLQKEVDEVKRTAMTEIVALNRTIREQSKRIAVLMDAVRENHEWHNLYDDDGGYYGSGLWQTNFDALGDDDGTDSEGGNQ